MFRNCRNGGSEHERRTGAPLKRESLTHGIQVEISDDNALTLNFHVIVAYGVNILSVSDNLMSNVKYKVEEFTGMTVEKINIFVEGVRVID